MGFLPDEWKNRSISELLRMGYFSVSVVIFLLAATSANVLFFILSTANAVLSYHFVKDIPISE